MLYFLIPSLLDVRLNEPRTMYGTCYMYVYAIIAELLY